MRRNRIEYLELLKLFNQKIIFLLIGFMEIKPGKLILNTGFGNFFGSYDYNGNFSFTKADHPLKDSIQSNLVDSLKNDLSLFQIHHLTGQILILVIFFRFCKCS